MAIRNTISAVAVVLLWFVWGYSAAQEAVDTVVFPDDFKSEADYIRYENKTLYFANTLVVSDNYYWKRYGRLTLSAARRFAPTDMAKPNSTEYQQIVAYNEINRILLDDGSEVENPVPLPFVDGNGTRRIGSRIDHLKAVLRRYNQEVWILVPVTDSPPQFYGNERPTDIAIANSHNLKVCSFNLEYYLTSNFGTGFGPANEAEAAKQHAKTVKALVAIDADIYGLIEIQQGQDAIRKLCNALNANKGSNVYSFIDDGGSVYGSYTKVGFIFRSDRVIPDGNLYNVNNVLPHRKKIQCFRLLSNNEKFVFSLNHFKSKTGKNATGDNADQKDGQGAFNGDRVREANAVLSAIAPYSVNCGDDNVLIMGDLNSYAEEDPLYVFYNKGYVNLLKSKNDSAYSYVYSGLSGCLDHAVANASMRRQIVDARVFHINADEPKMFEYHQSTSVGDMYRSSDHDAVVVALDLGGTNPTTIAAKDEITVAVAAGNTCVIENAEGMWLTVADITGRLLLRQYIDEKEKAINITTLPRGCYVFCFTDNRSKYIRNVKVVF